MNRFLDCLFILLAFALAVMLAPFPDDSTTGDD